MTVAIALHVALGVALAVVSWVAGAGALVALRLAPRGLAGPDLAYAFPFGLIAIVLPCFLFLIHPLLGALGAVVPVAAVTLAVVHGVVRSTVSRRAAWGLAATLPALATFAATLGALYDGPTQTRSGGAFGDMLWYVAKLASAQESLSPYRDLTAHGIELWKAELAPTLLGAALEQLQVADAFLFHAALLPAFLLAALCVGFVVTTRDADPPPASWVLVLAVLGVGTVAYPSWTVESSPVTLALPLAFAVHRLTCADPEPRVLLVVAVAVVVALVATKGFGLVLVSIVLAWSVVRRRLLSPRQLAAVALAVAAALVPVLVVTLDSAFWVLRSFDLRFVPLDAIDGLRAQLDTRSTQQLAPALNIVGAVALATAFWRSRAWPLLAGLVVSMAWIWTLAPNFLEIGFRLIVLLAVIRFWRRPADSMVRLAVAVAAGAIGLEAWLRDFAGLRAALILTCAMAAALFVALLAASFRGRRTAVAGVAAATLALAGAAAAVGIGERPAVLGPDDHGIWERVDDVVPEDGLVFTSLTGRGLTSREALSYYPAIVGRQVFLAGWYESELREDPEELDRRLRVNRAVLTGKVAPARAAGGKRFGGYYAVIRRGARAPGSFRLLHRNSAYALYRIGPG